MDDEEGIRKTLARALQGMGHVVEMAKDGQMAIEVFQTARSLGCPFDAVMLDLTVRGGMGGREALQALLKIDPAVKGIVMSGYSGDPAILAPDGCKSQTHRKTKRSGSGRGSDAKTFFYSVCYDTLNGYGDNDGGESSPPQYCQ